MVNDWGQPANEPEPDAELNTAPAPPGRAPVGGTRGVPRCPECGSTQIRSTLKDKSWCTRCGWNGRREEIKWTHRKEVE